MTNAELIRKIRNEIERNRKAIRVLNEHTAPEQMSKTCAIFQYSDSILSELLSFLDTLESEKPNQDELIEEVKRYYSDNFAYLSSDQPTLSILTNIARHFAQWGAERQKEQDDRLVDIIYQQGIEKGKDEMMELIKKEKENERSTTSGI